MLRIHEKATFLQVALINVLDNLMGGSLKLSLITFLAQDKEYMVFIDNSGQISVWSMVLRYSAVF